MKKLELINILNEQIAKENKFIETMKNEQNPQIAEMVNQAQGKLDAYENVLYYAQHNSALMFGEGYNETD